MKIFISGGCKNGKSTFAQLLAKRQQKAAPVASAAPLYYVATMAATDREDDRRIIRHRQEREGWGFTTVEQPRNISGILENCDASGSFLLDSLTALLANEMFAKDGSVDENAEGRIAAQLQTLLGCVENIVVVSDYIYSDAAIYDPLTQAYRKSLAALDRLVAEAADVVLEAVNTQIVVHKGQEAFESIGAAG